MAYDFDGAGDHIVFTKPAAATGLSVLSYSFHLVRDAHTGYREVFWTGGHWNTAHHSFVQSDTSNTYMVFNAQWNNSGNARWSITNPDTAWHNHVITYDYTATTNDPIWYIDGASQTVTERATPTGTPGYADDDGVLRIGAYYDGSGEYWDGKIAEFAIWNRILTATEAAILGAGFSPLFIPNGLVFYSPLMRNTQDIKGGNVGTVTNAVVFPHPRIIYPGSYQRYPGVTAAPSTSVKDMIGGFIPFAR